MVQALLDKRKTKTRRTKGLKGMNVNPDKWEITFHEGKLLRKTRNIIPMYVQTGIKCPYGEPGDVIWVRETFCYMDAAPNNYAYRADYGIDTVDWNWKPSIFMPKNACRIFLKITSIRVERLQDITEDDAITEGVKSKYFDNTNNHFDYVTKKYLGINAKISFFTLWVSINGNDSLANDPWVWVIEFEQIEKPENFC